MKDKIGRNINYMKVSLTDKCNLRCMHCIYNCSDEKSDRSSLSALEVITVVKAAARLGIEKIKYTGGEPLLVHNLDRIIYETKRIKGIKDVGITTNGIKLYDMIDDLKKVGLNRINISIPALDDKKYSYITRGGSLKSVIAGLFKCLSLGIENIKLNVYLLKGINDNEIYGFIKLTKDFPIEVRFIEIMPKAEAKNIFMYNFMSLEEVKNAHPELIPSGKESDGRTELYGIQGGRGRIGLIRPMSGKFCAGCNKIEMTHYGSIRQCVLSDMEYNVKRHLNNDKSLMNNLSRLIYTKPKEHYMEQEYKNQIMF